MNIVLTFNPAWAKHARLSVYSAISTNYKSDLTIYLMSGNLSNSDLDQFEQVREATCKELGARCSIKHINMLEHFPNYITKPMKSVVVGWGDHNLYRLFIPKLIPDKRVLYVDVDALIIKDISALWNIGLGDNLLAACIDTWAQRESPDYHRDVLGMTDSYINDGVILLNNEKLKSEGLFEKWVALTNEECERLNIPDQDVINKTTEHRRLFLDPIYNTAFCTLPDPKYPNPVTGFPEDDICVVHWAGPSKPWQFVFSPAIVKLIGEDFQPPGIMFYNIWKKWMLKYKARFPYEIPQ
jgi:lipopolysaccharide biosynthesis glycosyltransferase